MTPVSFLSADSDVIMRQLSVDTVLSEIVPIPNNVVFVLEFVNPVC